MEAHPHRIPPAERAALARDRDAVKKRMNLDPRQRRGLSIARVPAPGLDACIVYGDGTTTGWMEAAEARALARQFGGTVRYAGLLRTAIETALRGRAAA